MTLRTFSSGGGVQSTAALVLSAQGKIDFPIHLFANVGDDSENPSTLAYVREVLKPYALAHEIEFHELDRVRRDGTHETLLGRLTKEGSRSLPIPVRMSNGAPNTRSCTVDFKLQVLAKWQKAHGATAATPARVGIGFSIDEMHRVGKATLRPHEVIEYPLIDLGISRDNCMTITRKAGLPPAPRSACWFCPMHRPSAWSEMRRDDPEHFWASVKLEKLLNDRRDVLGKDHVYLTRFAKPLDEAVGEAQQTMFDQDGWGESCDEESWGMKRLRAVAKTNLTNGSQLHTAMTYGELRNLLATLDQALARCELAERRVEELEGPDRDATLRYIDQTSTVPTRANG